MRYGGLFFDAETRRRGGRREEEFGEMGIMRGLRLHAASGDSEAEETEEAEKPAESAGSSGAEGYATRV